MIITHESAQAIFGQWKAAAARVTGSLWIAPRESSEIAFSGTITGFGEKLTIQCDSTEVSLATLPSTIDYVGNLPPDASTNGHKARIQIVALVWRCQIFGPEVNLAE